ncbi:MAG: 6-aminohexanoate-cyclic-dimer hydrolase [Sphingomonas bacterium]|uniref:amidase n=1 Tax=Sphingomonas bacterium TaxID=1895847 RepID=UPI0026117BCD|nr:amidase [Sphingomonas bacterium]MDB5708649.1 6-aminohexanoate-cyclic-dimer hydrolase [Sphingomonas bacterium]
MAVDESANWDATETAVRIRSGAVSALEMVDAAIARAEALNPQLNFLVVDDFERARARAKGPLGDGPFAGVPYLIKDLDDMAGLATRSGSRSTADLGPATRQSPLIAGMLAAGLNPIGKSSTPEHGFLPTTEPLAFGPTRNPWDPTRSSGGSSGGAGAATAAHVVPFAHASDGGGSIRIPASCCGLFGLKVSRGRTLATDPGHFPISLSVQLCVSRSVRDSAGLFAAVEGTGAGLPPVGMIVAPSDRRLRIGLVIDSVTGRKPDPEVAAATEEMAALLEDLGHKVEPTAWPAELVGMADPFLLTWSKGAANILAEAATRLGHVPGPDEVEPFSLAMAGIVAMAPAGAVEQAVAYLNTLGGPYAAWLSRYDVILSPVLSTAPIPLGWLAPDLPVETMAERLPAYVGYTTPANVVGAPAMSVPGAWSAGGLPIGAQFQAAVGDEATLLALAYEIEAVRPWTGRRPGICA